MATPHSFFLRQIALLILLLTLGPSSAVSETAELGPQNRVVAIGDVHGDYEQFVLILGDAGLVNEGLKWTGGSTTLVQMGDVPDRGPDSRKVISLLRKLQKEARRAGGAVHCLIGNHESMNMTGDLRYVHPGEFAAFVTRDSRRIQEAHFEDGVSWLKAQTPKEQWPAFDETFKAEWFKQYPLGYVEHVRAWNSNGEIGTWVSANPAVLRIGDTLFVHGGLGPSYVGKTIDQINEGIRTALKEPGGAGQAVLRDPEGPLWYRGLAANPEPLERPHLEMLLSHFKVKRIVIGHTPTMGFVLPRFEGRVVQVDVGLSRHYGAGRACMLIENEEIFALHQGHRLDLPSSGPDEVIAYLKKAAALGASSPGLIQLIRQMENRLSLESSPPPPQKLAPQEVGNP